MDKERGCAAECYLSPAPTSISVTIRAMTKRFLGLVVVAIFAAASLIIAQQPLARICGEANKAPFCSGVRGEL